MRKNTQQVSEMLHSHQAQARYILVFLMLSALVVSFVCSALMMPAVSMTGSGDTAVNALSYGDTVDENGYPVYVSDPNAALGAATHFHIFAEEAAFSVHVCGNLAANLFHADGRDWGVRKKYWDDMSAITYLKDFDGTLHGNTLATKLVLGAGSTIQEADNGNRYAVTAPGGGRGELNKSSIRDGAFVEGPTPYIDITGELNKLAAKSVSVAGQADTPGVTLEPREKKLVLDVSGAAENTVYYTLDADSLGILDGTTSAPFERLVVKGLEVGSPKLLYLNIDLKGADKFELKTTLSVCQSANEEDYYSIQEVGNREGGVRIVYNFINTDESGAHSAFDGSLNVNNTVNGSVLAPRADIEVQHNLNGTIVGKKVNIHGETHKCDVERTGPILSTKTYENVNLNGMSEVERNKLFSATAFTLYKSYDAAANTFSDPVKTQHPIWDEVNLCASIQFGDGLENNMTYYLKETASPEGYALSEEYYICYVDSIGQVTYTKQGTTDPQTTMPAYENLLQTTPVTTTTVTTTTTTATTTTTTVTTTTTAVATTTTEAATTTTRGISIGVHKIWSDGASSHDGDTVVVEIHRSTNPADVPEQAKITTGAAATTTAAAATTTTAAATTTGKDPPSGNTVQLNDVMFGTVIDLSAYDYTNITEIALKISGAASGENGAVILSPNDTKFLFDQVESDGLIHVKLDAPNSPRLRIEKYYGKGTLESIILYFNTATTFDTDTIKPVLAGSNASPTWVQDLEIRKDSGGGWSAAAEDLPAADPEGNPYYYWIVETDFTGYDASYLYENSPGDRYITGKDGSVTVCNTKSTASVVMPSTGGSGTFAYRFIGVCLMTGTAGLYLLRRRKRRCSSA